MTCKPEPKPEPSKLRVALTMVAAALVVLFVALFSLIKFAAIVAFITMAFWALGHFVFNVC